MLQTCGEVVGIWTCSMTFANIHRTKQNLTINLDSNIGTALGVHSAQNVNVDLKASLLTHGGKLYNK